MSSEPPNKKLAVSTNDDLDKNLHLSVNGHHALIPTTQRTLVQASPYFAAMFHSPMKESLDKTIDLTIPENIDIGCFLAVLNSLSNTHVRLNINGSNVADFIVIARYLQLEQVEKQCMAQLFELPQLALGIDDLFRLWRKGYHHSLEPVNTAALWTILHVHGLKAIVKCMEFLDLDIEELASLLSDNIFHPPSEDQVCKALIAWCECTFEERTKPEILERLLKEIVWDDFNNDALYYLNAFTTGAVNEALNKVAIQRSNYVCPRRAISNLLFWHMTSGVSGQKTGQSFLQCNVTGDTLAACISPVLDVLHSKINTEVMLNIYLVETNGRLYEGELIAQNRFGNVLALNVVNFGYRIVYAEAPKFSMIFSTSTAIFGVDKTTSDSHDVLWRFDRTTGENAQFGIFEGENVYLETSSTCNVTLPLGTYTAFLTKSCKLIGPNDSIRLYNYNDNTWYTNLPSLPIFAGQRSNAAMVQCGVFLYIIGGRTHPDGLAQRDCYRLNLITRAKWERISDMPVARFNHCVFSKSDRVYVYGGSTSGYIEMGPPVTVPAPIDFETYNVGSNRWAPADPSIQLHRDVCMQSTYCIDLGQLRSSDQ